ncbi:MAG: NFACT RNA binding domain-containing protein [Planctomycetota bacterium]
MPADRDDLLLGLELPGQSEDASSRRVLQIAPGGARARVTTTTRRFSKRSLQTGPRIDRCDELLVGRQIDQIVAADGEKRVRLTLSKSATDGSVAIEVELFGPRGLWALTDASSRILLLSRLPNQKRRTLRPGSTYEPPARAPKPTAEEPTAIDSAEQTPRFAAPITVAVDDAYTELDRHEESRSELDRLIRATQRHRKKLEGRRQGFQQKLEAADRADEVRATADTLLAYSSQIQPGASELVAPHPIEPDRELRIQLDPRLQPHQQAERLYKAARKHAQGAEDTQRRLQDLDRQITALSALQDVLEDDPPRVAPLREQLEELGVVPRSGPEKVGQKEQKLRKVTQGENFRRFWSREGLLILVGRDNRQNDRLATRVARGNDLWFHVGRGYAGSHVVVRVQKGKSASLETLLDAGTLAIHFSKVRGAELEEVVYTQAKHVRKPKGLPAGKVVPSQTKTLRIRHEADRLERLLRSDAEGAPR